MLRSGLTGFLLRCHFHNIKTQNFVYAYIKDDNCQFAYDPVLLHPNILIKTINYFDLAAKQRICCVKKK